MEYRAHQSATDNPLCSPWPRRCPKCGSRLWQETTVISSGSTLDRCSSVDARQVMGEAAGWSCLCGFWEELNRTVLLSPELAQLARGVRKRKQPEVYTTTAYGGRLSKAAQEAVRKHNRTIKRLLSTKIGWESIAIVLRGMTGARFHHETLRRYYLLQQQERGA